MLETRTAHNSYSHHRNENYQGNAYDYDDVNDHYVDDKAFSEIDSIQVDMFVCVMTQYEDADDVKYQGVTTCLVKYFLQNFCLKAFILRFTRQKCCNFCNKNALIHNFLG